jgi:hypothetical protein
VYNICKYTQKTVTSARTRAHRAPSPKAGSTVGTAATRKMHLHATLPVSAAQLPLSQIRHCVAQPGSESKLHLSAAGQGRLEQARKQPYTQQRRSSHSAGAQGPPPRSPTGATTGETWRVCSAEQAPGASAAALPCFLVVGQLTGVQNSAVIASDHIQLDWTLRFGQSDQ